jgi:hypothetical protein
MAKLVVAMLKADSIISIPNQSFVLNYEGNSLDLGKFFEMRMLQLDGNPSTTSTIYGSVNLRELKMEGFTNQSTSRSCGADP